MMLKHPNSPDCQAVLAHLHIFTNKLQQALVTLRGTLLIDPDHRNAGLLLKRAIIIDATKQEADRLYSAGHYKDAVDRYSETLKT